MLLSFDEKSVEKLKFFISFGKFDSKNRPFGNITILDVLPCGAYATEWAWRYFLNPLNCSYRNQFSHAQSETSGNANETMKNYHQCSDESYYYSSYDSCVRACYSAQYCTYQPDCIKFYCYITSDKAWIVARVKLAGKKVNYFKTGLNDWIL